MDLPVALDMPTRSIKDVLKTLFGLGLYLLDRIIVVELSVVPPLFALVTIWWGDVKEVDETKAIVKALIGSDNKVSKRGKGKTKVLLKVLESRQGSRL
ncbi:hypothetical protein B296_00021210 [Ensete ventricosum]|uniref:Uncharacterized protein n=1 Tax=Ensete ventricosum TaxID=4639 RepID=A0A427AIS1_ENSVE|nr:hypothetical protein B296_00021210 [Ensete ventricosum]